MSRSYVGKRGNSFHTQYDAFAHEVRETTNETMALLKATSLADLRRLVREVTFLKFPDKMGRFDGVFDEYIAEAKQFLSGEFMEFIDSSIDEYIDEYGLDLSLVEIMYSEMRHIFDNPRNNVYEQLEIDRKTLIKQVILDRIEDLLL